MTVEDMVIRRRISEWEEQNPYYKKKAFICDQCGNPIYSGDTYHLLFGRVLCPECAEEFVHELLDESKEEAV